MELNWKFKFWYVMIPCVAVIKFQQSITTLQGCFRCLMRSSVGISNSSLDSIKLATFCKYIYAFKHIKCIFTIYKGSEVGSVDKGPNFLKDETNHFVFNRWLRTPLPVHQT